MLPPLRREGPRTRQLRTSQSPPIAGRSKPGRCPAPTVFAITTSEFAIEGRARPRSASMPAVVAHQREIAQTARLTIAGYRLHHGIPHRGLGLSLALCSTSPTTPLAGRRALARWFLGLPELSASLLEMIDVYQKTLLLMHSHIHSCDTRKAIYLNSRHSNSSCRATGYVVLTLIMSHEHVRRVYRMYRYRCINIVQALEAALSRYNN